MSQYINKFQGKLNLLEDAEIIIPDELQSIMLLNSLPENYENFCVAMESRDQIRVLDFLKGKLLEEETRRKGNESNEDNTTSALISRRARHSREKSTPESKHTFKDNRAWKEFNGKCYNCGKYGHPAARCRLRRKEEGRANQVYTSDD